MAKAIATGKNGKRTFDFDVLTGEHTSMQDVRFLDPSTSSWSTLGSYSTNEQIKQAVSGKIGEYGYENPMFYGI